MTFLRSVEPEWLDELPADDPRAIRSRRDLKRVNAWMLQTRIMARLFTSRRMAPPRTIIELGSGDGTFMLSVARCMAPQWPGVRVVFLDLQNIVSERTRDDYLALGWSTESVTADVFNFLGAQKAGAVDLITANLFLHHFSRDQLGHLFAAAARLAPWFVACEPRRSTLALVGSHMLFAIGCNDVSRHDAVVSVRAGFSDRELSDLWPAIGGWSLQEHAALPFTHCFVAHRTDGANPDV
jgi:hypothetical protein